MLHQKRCNGLADTVQAVFSFRNELFQMNVLYLGEPQQGTVFGGR